MFLLRSFEKNLHVSWKNLHALIRKENFNSSENTDYFGVYVSIYEYNKINKGIKKKIETIKGTRARIPRLMFYDYRKIVGIEITFIELFEIKRISRFDTLIRLNNKER